VRLAPDPGPRPALVVIAKAPRPGRVKTRLCPPCTPAEAAALARAALEDTLAEVGRVPARRHVLALEGAAGPWVPAGFEVIPQVAGGLDRRLAAAADAVGGPLVILGMDTPQVEAAALAAACEALSASDAVLGPALDGGYWAIGLARALPEAIAGVPMSVPWTAAAQRARFRELGLSWIELPPLRDADTFEDARAVAASRPRGSFAATLHAIEDRWRRGAAAAAFGSA
jgi:uncharacterized protein